ncbi:hypothetical protein MGM1_3300 [Candidatus Malacoplasma girerdii]|uniref:Uncharacterized protein n=1 Tax=Candidatus Malacoplasma girerdii TaxID=1318617 RepID=A0A097SSX3_9BACT|nr:hypothetical protein MGM1_3300 [Candidatus Malacoplasma girerdii]
MCVCGLDITIPTGSAEINAIPVKNFVKFLSFISHIYFIKNKKIAELIAIYFLLFLRCL